MAVTSKVSSTHTQIFNLDRLVVLPKQVLARLSSCAI